MYAATVRALVGRARVHAIDRRLLVAFALGYPLWQGVVRGGRALDALLAGPLPPIVAPVFVVGHPRSGTTLLHRLLARDPSFCAPRAWELLFPAVTLHRLGERLGRGRFGAEVARFSERELFAGFAARHATGWLDPEEDDWLLLHALASPTVALLSGVPAATSRYQLGDRLPAAERERILAWYRGSVRRILAANGGGTWLSKSPPFTGWLRTLAAAFPDARFVLAARDPEEAVASHLEMTTRAWYRGGRGVTRDDPRIREVFAASVALYRHAAEVWPSIPAERRAVVDYRALVADPAAEIGSLAAHFGWDPPDLADAAATARRRVPSAPVRLRSFGIRAEELREAIGEHRPWMK